MDQDRMKSVKVFDPANKCHFRILLPEEKFEEVNKIVKKEKEDTNSRELSQNFTTWNNTETLALINIFSLFKDRFKKFKRRRQQWKLISEELAKIGIYKIPEKCEIKWKNLLRVYRQHKLGNKGRGKFEFFNELDDIIANDEYYSDIFGCSSNVTQTLQPNSNYKLEISQIENCNKSIQLPIKRCVCGCAKSEKQKRHEDRMKIMTKKMEIEERKVKAFEEYLQFLKSTVQNT